MKHKYVLVSSGLLLSFVFGAIGGLLSAYVFTDISFEKWVDDEDVDSADLESVSDFTYAWEQASPAVLSVVARKDLSEYYGQFFGGENLEPTGELTDVSSGTAFLVTKDGLAVTNRHVVSDTDAEYVAILNDGTELPVEILDKDTLNDIALIRVISKEDLPTLEFADSEKIEVGDPVLAIGNALGEYANTTTSGIISALGRQITATGPLGVREFTLINLIQTDAAINLGNSGGPLVNLEGKLVGMNTAIDTYAQGIGFAIPANEIDKVVDSYKEFGHIVRPFLGIRSVTINPSMQQQYDLPVDYGAYVYDDRFSNNRGVVQGSPADKAGIVADDIILSVNGQDITEAYDLTHAVSEYEVGDEVRLEVLREEETIEIKVILEERKE